MVDDSGVMAPTLGRRRQHPDQTTKGGQVVEKELGIGQLEGAEQGEPAQQPRSLLPPMTARMIFRALLGVLLFFCGIVFGAWLIFRFRRHIEEHNEPHA